MWLKVISSTKNVVEANPFRSTKRWTLDNWPYSWASPTSGALYCQRMTIIPKQTGTKTTNSKYICTLPCRGPDAHVWVIKSSPNQGNDHATPSLPALVHCLSPSPPSHAHVLDDLRCASVAFKANGLVGIWSASSVVRCVGESDSWMSCAAPTMQTPAAFHGPEFPKRHLSLDNEQKRYLKE